MTKEQKIQVVQELTEKFKEYPNFYVTDTGGMNVADVNALRRKCFESGVQLHVIKNTLIKKALENLEEDYSEIYDSLKLQSAVFFADEENPNTPAKVIQNFRKDTKLEIPRLKAACIDASVFIGDDQVEVLASMKSKSELIGEIIGLLQSPAKNVISALKSASGDLAGILKTLSEKEN